MLGYGSYSTVWLAHQFVCCGQGTHFVLVTEVVVPFLPTLRFQPTYVMHSYSKIVHGGMRTVCPESLITVLIYSLDLHLGNVGFFTTFRPGYDVLSPYDFTPPPCQ